MKELTTAADKITRYSELWTIAVPNVKKPSVQDASHWLRFDPAIVEKVILRAGRRFAPGKLEEAFDPHQAYRFVTAVACDCERGYLTNSGNVAA